MALEGGFDDGIRRRSLRWEPKHYHGSAFLMRKYTCISSVLNYILGQIDTAIIPSWEYFS